MAKLRPLASDAVVDIPDELVERYAAQGWTVADDEKRKPGRPKKSE